MIDSIHRAAHSLCPFRKGIFNRAGGTNPADEPESFTATNGAEPSPNLNYGAPQPVSCPGTISYEYESTNRRIKQHYVKLQTGYKIGNDNGAVTIEANDQQKIRGIRNQTGNNIGSRNGVIEIRNGSQRKIHGISNRTGNNVGNNNGVVRIGNFHST